MSTTYSNAQGNNGTITASVSAPGAGGCWALTAVSVSLAGPTGGGNGKVTVWDGAVGTGTVIHAEFLPIPATGSAGVTLKLSIPTDPQGRPLLQATPGNAMNVQVTGTGANQVSLNCRFTDGLP